MEKYMIPKIIHYCWFGHGEKPKLAQKCIASWSKYCPDYEIIEWNEDNFDINKNAYTKMCYDQRKYAFLTDYVRLVIIEEYGGIYFDTDVELLKSVDDVLGQEAYIGFENNNYVNTGMGFGSVRHGKMVQTMIKQYEPLLDGMHGTIGCPTLNTRALELLGLKKNGQLQQLAVANVYPKEYFNPYDDPTGRLNITENTISIHWCMKSALSKKEIIRSNFTRPVHRLFGVDVLKRFRK